MPDARHQRGRESSGHLREVGRRELGEEAEPGTPRAAELERLFALASALVERTAGEAVGHPGLDDP